MSRFHKFFIPVICILSGFYAIVSSQPVDDGVEFLVYNKDHWMDALTVQDRKDRNIPDAIFNYRYQRGDIVEVRPKGFWVGASARGYNTKAFRVVSVPGITMEQANKYQDSNDVRKRRYTVLSGATIVDKVTQ